VSAFAALCILLPAVSAQLARTKAVIDTKVLGRRAEWAYGSYTFSVQIMQATWNSRWRSVVASARRTQSVLAAN
jgi:hypothetical protein